MSQLNILTAELSNHFPLGLYIERAVPWLLELIHRQGISTEVRRGYVWLTSIPDAFSVPTIVHIPWSQRRLWTKEVFDETAFRWIHQGGKVLMIIGHSVLLPREQLVEDPTRCRDIVRIFLADNAISVDTKLDPPFFKQ